MEHTPTTVQHVCDFLAAQAPLALAEEWDNVGLLVGDPARHVQRIMTCLTVTPATVAEAVREKAGLIITHHPLPFRPLKQLTPHTVTGGLLLKIIEAGIAVFSAHTAFDSAAAGINQSLAEGCGLRDVQPLVPAPDQPGLGAGRWGKLPASVTLRELGRTVCRLLGIAGLQRIGEPEHEVRTIAVACGSAGQFLADARRAGCDVLITGETHFHTCLEAEATGVALLLTGHFASERFGMERLAVVVGKAFPGLTVWASRDERDPIEWTEYG